MALNKLITSLIILMCTHYAAAWSELEPKDYQSFFSQYCSGGSNFVNSIFPSLSDKDSLTIDILTENLLWYDMAMYLTNEPDTRMERIINDLQSRKIPVSARLLRLKQDMQDKRKRAQIVIYTNNHGQEISDSHEALHIIAKSDPHFAIAIDTLTLCKTVTNSKNLQSVMLQRLKVIEEITVPAQSNSTPSPYSDCSCAGKNVCFGPRGGRYCLTNNGNKRYGI